MRRLALVAIAAIIPFAAWCPGALACIAYENNRTIFYDEIPERTDATFIAKVAVIGLRYVPDKPYLWGWRYSFEGYAGVVDVIKGTIDKPVFKIAMEASSCDGPLTVGSAGIVIGVLRANPDGSITLKPMSESYGERRARKNFGDF
jgi:hypothetical protein